MARGAGVAPLLQPQIEFVVLLVAWEMKKCFHLRYLTTFSNAR